MGQFSKVNGTFSEIHGGKCRVDGTEHSVKKGRTLIEGTGYDINFRKKFTVTITSDDASSRFYVLIDNTKYGISSQQMQNETITLRVREGTVITLYAAGWEGDSGSQKGKIYFNDENVATSTNNSYVNYSFELKSDIEIVTTYVLHQISANEI